VRYFIAQQLGGREVIRVTLDQFPKNLDNQAMEFRDGNIETINPLYGIQRDKRAK